MSENTNTYVDGGVETPVTFHPDGNYVTVHSKMDDFKRRWWSEPTATEMRDMVDHLLRGRGLKRTGRRYVWRRRGGNTVTGIVWRYDLTSTD